MRRLPAAPLALAAFATLVLAGCSSAPEPDLSPVEAAYAAHTACLGENGVKLKETRPGYWEVDKAVLGEEAAGKEAMRTAQDACADLLPTRLPVDPEALEMTRRITECYRRNGYPDWPDPDPTTGEHPAGVDMNDSAVMRKCNTASG